MYCKLLTLVVLFVAASHGQSASASSSKPKPYYENERQDANIADYPYHVSINLNGTFFLCDGVIINERFVLSSTFCYYVLLPEILTIRANSTQALSGGVTVPVKKYTFHPKFNDSYLDYGVTILELEEPLVFGQGVQAVDLAEEFGVVKAGTRVNSTGFGAAKGGFLNDLRSVELEVMSNEDCQNATNTYVTENMLCSISDDGFDPEVGELGSALVSYGTLWGIMSMEWYFPDARLQPGIYVNVGMMRDFIKNITGL